MLGLIRCSRSGTVSVLWAFAEKPKETLSILCHVIPRCTYDLILGNGFLTGTKTLTKFCHRMTRCLFSVVNSVPHFGFLGETYQRLEGTLDDRHSVLAIPDTGADRNVMSLQYALDHGFALKTGEKRCGYLQFADGSYEKTVGQVETYWTFASGERIPVTFEVLEYCCSEVIIGEEILTEQNVFIDHAASILLTATLKDDDSYELAPFDFMNSWQRSCKKVMNKAASLRKKRDTPARNGLESDNGRIQEQHRRNIWNYQYDFGNEATTIEKHLESARKERYESERPDPGAAAPNAETPPPQHRIPRIPSIPTSQS